MSHYYTERAMSRTTSLTGDQCTLTREFLVFADAACTIPVADPEEAAHEAELRTATAYPVPREWQFAYGSAHPSTSFGSYLVAQIDTRLEPGSQNSVLTVTYHNYQSPEYETWSFDIASEQRHITSVPDNSYIEHFPALNYGTAINATSERVEGVDVFRSRMSIKVSKLYATLADVPYGHIVNAASTVNSAAWVYWGVEQVLFLGAQITPTGVGSRQNVDYNFMVGPYQSPTVLLYDGSSVSLHSPGLAVVAPWDYVWFRYRLGVDTGVPRSNPTDVHVAQVYDLYDFSLFGLAGPT